MSGQRRYMAVNEALGGKHWTQEEKERRKATEVKGDSSKKVMAPKWLTDKSLREEFYRIAKQLNGLNVGFCQMDADFLAWYLTAREQYNEATAHVEKAIQDGDRNGASKWVKTRNTLFSEAKACAGELGLTVSSRCKLVIPAVPEEEENPLEELRNKIRVMRDA